MVTLLYVTSTKPSNHLVGIQIDAAERTVETEAETSIERAFAGRKVHNSPRSFRGGGVNEILLLFTLHSNRYYTCGLKSFFSVFFSASIKHACSFIPSWLLNILSVHFRVIEYETRVLFTQV